jgi:hypothetical protein
MGVTVGVGSTDRVRLYACFGCIPCLDRDQSNPPPNQNPRRIRCQLPDLPGPHLCMHVLRSYLFVLRAYIKWDNVTTYIVRAYTVLTSVNSSLRQYGPLSDPNIVMANGNVHVRIRLILELCAEL